MSFLMTRQELFHSSICQQRMISEAINRSTNARIEPGSYLEPRNIHPSNSKITTTQNSISDSYMKPLGSNEPIPSRRAHENKHDMQDLSIQVIKVGNAPMLSPTSSDGFTQPNAVIETMAKKRNSSQVILDRVASSASNIKIRENTIKSRTQSNPNIQSIRAILNKSVKTLNSQEKLNLLKISERSGDVDPHAQSRFNFYWVNQKALGTQTQISNQKNIFVQRKYHQDFERQNLRTAMKKSSTEEMRKSFSPTKKLNPMSSLGQRTQHKSFQAFYKVEKQDASSANPFAILPALSIKKGYSKPPEEPSPERLSPSQHLAETAFKSKSNVNSLQKYLLLFCEIEKLTREIEDPETIPKASMKTLSKLPSRPEGEIILDYAYVKDKKISLRALKQRFSHVFSRSKFLGDRILTCLNISPDMNGLQFLGFEKFHNFARFVVFYDATFKELTEFMIRFFGGRSKICSVPDFKTIIKDLISHRITDQSKRDKTAEKLFYQFKDCNIIEKESEPVNFDNFRLAYGNNKLNVFYLMDLITNKK